MTTFGPITSLGPSGHCPGPASRARTSRAAGSSATSPAPGEAEGLALGESRKGALRSHDPGPSEQTTWRAFPPEVRLGAHPHGQLGSGQGWQNDPLPLRARDAGAGPALTALKDASRGQWPKQCCRNRYSFCWTNLGTAALRGTGASPHRAQATASRVQPLPQRTPQGPPRVTETTFKQTGRWHPRNSKRAQKGLEMNLRATTDTRTTEVGCARGRASRERRGPLSQEARAPRGLSSCCPPALTGASPSPPPHPTQSPGRP